MKKADSGLLKNNCFLKDAYSFVDLKTQYPKKQYLSCDVITTIGPDGVPVAKHEFSLHDYEITPDSVDSQVEAADYRNDVMGAIAGSKPGKNLGDVSSMQDILDMDDSQAFALMAQLQERFSSSSKNASSVDAEKENLSKIDDKGGVKNNVD